MDRYRSYRDGGNDDRSSTLGDKNFVGVNQYDSIEDIPPGEVQEAVNMDFTKKSAETRGGFVCIPELGTQPFGQVWTQQTSPNVNWRGVTYGGGQFVAVGYATAFASTSIVATSPDGETWTSRTAVNNGAWKSVAYGNGVYVAVSSGHTSGSDDYIMSSTDGITWTTRTNNTDPLDIVVYGNGTFVALGTTPSFTYTSTNGTSWTKHSTLSGFSSDDGMTFGNGTFLIVRADGTKVATSTDGFTWTYTTVSIGNWTSGGVNNRPVAYGNGVFVVQAGTGSYTSTNGTAWTSYTFPVNLSGWDLFWARNQFLWINSSGSNCRYFTSFNGSVWKEQTAPSDSTGTDNFVRFAYGNNHYVVVGASAQINSMALTGETFIYGSGIYSDPNDAGSQWVMMVAATEVGFFAFGKTSRRISLGSYTVNEQSTIVQCNNLVYLFRGANAVPLYWDGNWSSDFTAVPETTPAAGFETIPYSNQATYYQNRLWVINGKDTVSASDVLDFNTYDQLANEFNINTGSSDYLVTSYPFGVNSLIVFKNKSVMILNNVDGSLTDVTATEVTRQIGCVGINAVCSIGPDLAYVSNRNINLLTLTSTNNSVQHKTLPLSAKIHRIMDRVNWEAASKISLGYWDNKIYVALPLDNSTTCNAVVVYNFITEKWFGEWNFSSDIDMNIQGWAVVDYLGLQRLHAITEDGRIFVTDEGYADISGTTVAEISTSLTTRAYEWDESIAAQRRLFLDLYTWRPKYSVSSFTDGVSEESVLLTDQQYSRSQSWKFNDSTYTLTNANDDYNRALRKDYSTGPDSVQCGTGFLPEAVQSIRIPLITRRQNRLSWLEVTNTQGYIQITTAGFEVRPGMRSNLVTA